MHPEPKPQDIPRPRWSPCANHSHIAVCCPVSQALRESSSDDDTFTNLSVQIMEPFWHKTGRFATAFETTCSKKNCKLLNLRSSTHGNHNVATIDALSSTSINLAKCLRQLECFRRASRGDPFHHQMASRWQNSEGNASKLWGPMGLVLRVDFFGTSWSEWCNDAKICRLNSACHCQVLNF